MNVWNTYRNRISSSGDSKRDVFLKREKRYIKQKSADTLSHYTVTIDGHPQEVTILSSDLYNKKKIIAMPDEVITHGGLVFWNEYYWIITEKDYDNTLYSKGTMIQCNQLIKWVTDDREIIESYCVIEDGAQASLGEESGSNAVITTGNSKIIMTLPKNNYTELINRGRRFFISNGGASSPIPYRITKALKGTNIYQDEGVYLFVLEEDVLTSFDSVDLQIADYYKYFPKSTVVDPDFKEVINLDNKDEYGGQVWL